MTNLNIEELQKMKEVNIREVDKDKLVDLQKVKIKKELPIPERVVDFIAQIGNPYCFRVGDMVVKLKFQEDGTSCQEAFYSMANIIR